MWLLSSACSGGGKRDLEQVKFETGMLQNKDTNNGKIMNK